mgnify:CR=1 FL=1|tara:strand:- start:4187 stop:4705 length:519 start_codon:yes stop_codon:yes gene_type:complete
MSLDLTIAIPCKNEESNLPGCLSAIGHSFAKEIILIDSNSTDQTNEIGRRFGAQILDFSWNGQFPKKRNWFLRNHPPQTEWILFLDADEYITEAFKKEIREEISNTKKAGFWLHYNIYFLGKPLKGGTHENGSTLPSRKKRTTTSPTTINDVQKTFKHILILNRNTSSNHRV